MSVYEGSENYIFVSYAHKDSAVVIPIISALQAAGFRVWYDQGIQAGSEWPAYIEEHLKKCECVLVCMSPTAVNSQNCRNEINLACKHNKSILVVYLEETDLINGMDLQLSSQQSLFRNRHSDDKQFLSELVKANILMPCKAGAGSDLSFLGKINIPKKDQSNKNNGTYTGTKTEAKPAISRVGTMGSNTPGEAWPNGTYSQIIDVNKFKTVHFHCSLIHPCSRPETKTVVLKIFDSRNNLVFDNTSRLSFNAGHDRFSIGWNIRDEAGLAQAADNYTAIIQVDDSRAFEYPFTLAAVDRNVSDGDMRELERLKKRLQYPKIYFLQLVSFISGLIAFTGLASANFDAMLIPGIIWIIFSIIVYRKTKDNVIKITFLAFIFSFFGSVYYNVYLFIMMIVSLVNRQKWNERIKELQSRLY